MVKGKGPVNLFDMVWSVLLVLAVILTLMILAPEKMYHWFLIPVGGCGILILPDAIRWLRREYDTFDPKGIIGLLGVHFFLLAPLLFVFLDLEMLYVSNPVDWRLWIGYAALLNFWGLLIYQLFAGMSQGPSSQKKLWTLEPWRFWLFTALFMLVAGACQLFFLANVGGVAGLIEETTARSGVFVGNGWLVMFGESLPILFFFAATYLHQKKWLKASPLIIILILLFFIVFQFFLAGLRGSRCTTIYAVFWATGIIHYLWRPIRPRQIMISLIPVFIFMVLYGFYKDLGIRVLDLASGEVSYHEIQSEAPDRGVLPTLFIDFSRVDAQAYLVYKLSGPEGYQPAYGRTYLGDLSILIPRSLWPDRPPTKVKEGTEILYGPVAYQPNSFESSYVYGLMGESLLNYHFVGVPIAFGVWGFLVSRVRYWLRNLPPGDARRLLAPLLVLTVVTILSSDLDNITFNLIKNGFVPFLVVVLGSVNHSKRVEVSE
jgi:hypothetical protein